MSVRWLPTSIFALVVALLAAHFAAIPEVPANAPFVYVPPASFAPVDEGFHGESSLAEATKEGNVNHLWVEPSAVSTLDARVIESHSTHVASLEEAALTEIAAGMPAVYEKSHGAWSETRHLVHIRPDGAKVGLIVGDLKTADNAHMQTMQMLFPDDSGSSIVTASFDHASTARLSPLFEKSLDDATGVKKLGKSAPDWVYLTWGLGALLFAVAAQFLNARRARA